jgi:GTP pyrophosphokinase
VGAKTDGRRAPLWTRLRNGQSVEILRAEAQRPSPVWMDMAVTGRARTAIRRALRDDKRDENIRRGRAIVKQAFERRGHDVTDKAVETAARKLARLGPDDLFEAVGAGDLSGRRVVESVYAPPGATEPEPSVEPGAPTVQGLSAGERPVFATCCHPIPGERIIGVRDGPEIVIHAIDCPVLEGHEHELDKWRDLRWDEDAALFATHVARLEMTLANEPGALARMCALIADQRANIDYLLTAERQPDYFRIIVDVEVRDVKHLDGILTVMEAQPIVSTAVRKRAQPEAPAMETTGELVNAARRGA